MVTILTAYSESTGAIGNKGALPWPSLKRDFQFMKYLTIKNPSGIIMGRRTFESIGRPLPNRTSIILTSADRTDSTENDPIHNYRIYYRKSLSEAVDLCSALKIEPVIFGGERVYREALQKYPCTIYITEVHKKYEGDAFFPVDLIDRSTLINITGEVLQLLENLKEEKEKKEGKEKKDNSVEGNNENASFCGSITRVCDNEVFYSFLKGFSTPLEK